MSSMTDKSDHGFSDADDECDDHDDRVDVSGIPKTIWNGENTDPTSRGNYDQMDYRGMDDHQAKVQSEVNASRIAAKRGSRFPNFVDQIADCLTDHVEIPNEELVQMANLVTSFMGVCITYQLTLTYPHLGNLAVVSLRNTNQPEIRATVLPQEDASLKFLIVNEYIGIGFLISFDSLENISFDFARILNAEMDKVMKQGTDRWKVDQADEMILSLAKGLDFALIPEACSYFDPQHNVLVYDYRHKYRRGVHLVGVREGNQHKCCVVRVDMKNVDFVVGLNIFTGREERLEKVMLGEFADLGLHIGENIDASRGVDMRYTVVNEYDFITVRNWQDAQKNLEENLKKML